MNIQITGRHTSLKARDREHIEEKSARFCKFFDRIIRVEIVLDPGHKGGCEAEMIVHVPRHTFSARETGEHDVMAAFDAVFEKMERQLRKHKERITERKTTGRKFKQNDPV